MESKIELVSGKNHIAFGLNESKTAEKLKSILPVKSEAQVWGNEIYFSIPLEHELEQGEEILEVGDIAYWPPGNAFCIFFGRTPASTDRKPRAAGPVTVLGHISDSKDVGRLKKIKQGDPVELKLS
ncbi:MAG: cyclophilin-like fold protein [Actinomycetota bacterium]